MTWFTKLAYAVSLGHGRFSPRVLLRTAHISGALLLCAGLFMGGRLVLALAKHRQNQLQKDDRKTRVVGDTGYSNSGLGLQLTLHPENRGAFTQPG